MILIQRFIHLALIFNNMKKILKNLVVILVFVIALKSNSNAITNEVFDKHYSLLEEKIDDLWIMIED